MPTVEEISEAINEFIIATYVKKNTKTLIKNTLIIIKNYSNNKEKIIIDRFLNLIETPYIKSEDRYMLKKSKQAIIKIINKYKELYINDFNNDNQCDEECDGEASMDSSNEESDEKASMDPSNEESDEEASMDPSNEEIAKMLVNLRKQGQLKITNENISLNEDTYKNTDKNMEQCTIN
jgi:hypothetical protein